MPEPTALPPIPWGPVPTPRQLAWHELEYYGFVHFTINTFTDKEWGFGDESPALFDPTAFDAGQLAGAAAAAGMAGLILTCKHHDGFCLWPSRYTEHSVKNSPWRGGRADLVAEMAEACRREGLRFGVYLSPWDRNFAAYGRPEYVDYYRRQLRELLTGYGPLFEVWFDGANGGDGYYGGACETRRIDPLTYYGWQETWELVRQLQPEACMFSDAGPDVRWVGNEHGVAGDPCWHTLDRGEFTPGVDQAPRLNRGQRPGSHWVPAECDVSIRPGWFYHAAEDDRVRSPENLFELYLQSVGRGASLLLNLPPDRRGLFHPADVESLEGFARLRQRVFAHDLAAGARASADQIRGGSPAYAPHHLLDGAPDTYWAADDPVREALITLELPAPCTFDLVDLREYLPLGQRLDRFAIEVDTPRGWQPFAQGEGVGRRRLARGPRTTTGRLRLRLGSDHCSPALAHLSLHLSP
ncbi:MAG: alpha-L-fucosidase [Candidatus Latescibacteria bacterium]|nr:alpha-L-fucosidase [Candidatus Latescibacterota bacterium]